MLKTNRSRRKTSTIHPPLQRSNLAVARAVLRALNHPKQRHCSDRALGRRLGLDHKTIGRWRKRLSGGEVPQTILTKNQFLSACGRVTAILPDVMWGDPNKWEITEVSAAYVALHRVLYGAKTLPDRSSQLQREVQGAHENEE